MSVVGGAAASPTLTFIAVTAAGCSASSVSTLSTSRVSVSVAAVLMSPLPCLSVPQDDGERVDDKDDDDEHDDSGRGQVLELRIWLAGPSVDDRRERRIGSDEAIDDRRRGRLREAGRRRADQQERRG